MNRLESLIYSRLKQHPDMKDAIRTAYQVAHLPWIGKRHDCERPLTTAPNYFFGFHDKTPWCPDNRRILAHRLPDAFEPGAHAVDVGYFVDDGLTVFQPIGKTEAWSKQQGAQLQWCGTSGNVIYNARRSDGAPCSIVCQMDGSGRHVLDFPIGAVDAEGRHACVVEFGSFGIGMTGYGYGAWAARAYRDRRTDEAATGLTELDTRSQTVMLRFSLAALAKMVGWSLSPAWHTFLSHPQYSPDGERLAFFVRRSSPGRRVQTQMCVLDKASATVTLMQSGDWVSHYCWLSNDDLLVYLEDVAGQRRFQVLSARDGVGRHAVGLPMVDGHPHFTPAGSLLVVDSYADRRRRQSLSIFRFDGTDQFAMLETMRFYSPLRYRNEDRVDLHPRWDREGRQVCIDSSYGGRRSLTVIKNAAPG